MDAKRCTAKAKTTGKRCKRTPHPGAKVCVIHGAGGPQVKQAALRRVQDERARRAVAVLGAPREIDPHAALLEEVHRSAGRVRTHELLLDELRPDPQIEDGVLQVLDERLDAERRNLIFACRTAVQCGCEQARVDLAKGQGALIAGIFKAVFGDPAVGLTPAQRRAAAVAAAGRLRVIDGGREAA